MSSFASFSLITLNTIINVLNNINSNNNLNDNNNSNNNNNNNNANMNMNLGRKRRHTSSLEQTQCFGGKSNISFGDLSKRIRMDSEKKYLAWIQVEIVIFIASS